jgi:hypothetical protein
MAGLPEDLESAEVIEKRWKEYGLEVTKPRYNALFSYPDDNNLNRYGQKQSDSNSSLFPFFSSVTLTSGGATIIQTAGVEVNYDPKEPKTVNPFLAYTPNGTRSSVSIILVTLEPSNNGL